MKELWLELTRSLMHTNRRLCQVMANHVRTICTMFLSSSVSTQDIQIDTSFELVSVRAGLAPILECFHTSVITLIILFIIDCLSCYNSKSTEFNMSNWILRRAKAWLQKFAFFNFLI